LNPLVPHRPSPTVGRADELMRRESVGAAAFESRWTRRALQRVDPDLSQRLDEQCELFAAALLSDDEDEIVLQGEAMTRGWRAAYARMSAERTESDDAYLLGEDPASGTRVAISAQRSSAERVRELYGDEVIFLTPDEVAAMAAPLHPVGTVKALWPGAEIVVVKKR
jgi:hypothetical protein